MAILGTEQFELSHGQYYYVDKKGNWIPAKLREDGRFEWQERDTTSNPRGNVSRFDDNPTITRVSTQTYKPEYFVDNSRFNKWVTDPNTGGLKWEVTPYEEQQSIKLNHLNAALYNEYLESERKRNKGTKLDPKQARDLWLGTSLSEGVFNPLALGYYTDGQGNTYFAPESDNARKAKAIDEISTVASGLVSSSFIPGAASFMTKWFVLPSLLGEAWNQGNKALGFTPFNEQVTNYLNGKKWNPFAAQLVGDMFNPGYWVNPLGGSVLKPFVNGLFDSSGQALREAGMKSVSDNLTSSYVKSLGLNRTPIDWFDKTIETPLNQGKNWIWDHTPSTMKYILSPKYRQELNNSTQISIYDQIEDWHNAEKAKLNKKFFKRSGRANSSYLIHLKTFGNDREQNMSILIDAPSVREKPVEYIDENGIITTGSTQFQTPFFNPEVKFKFNPYHYFSPYNAQVISSKQSPIPQKTDPNIVQAILERNSRLEKRLNGQGKITGSSKLAAKKIIADIPGDDDIITTQARYPELLKNLEGVQGYELSGTDGYKVESPYFRRNENNRRTGDVDLILENRETGRAYGKLAHEIYEMLFPEQYNIFKNQIAKQQSINEVKGLSVKFIQDHELPISAEELYQTLDENTLIEKGLADVLFSHKEKHALRAKTAIAQPEHANLISQILSKKAISLYGQDIYLPSTFDLTNIEANKKLLSQLGLNESLADDPKIMKNICKYLYLSQGSYTRGLKITELIENNPEIAKKSENEIWDYLYNAFNRLSAYDSMSQGSGRGGNTTTGSRGGDSYGDALTIYLTNLPEHIDNPEKLGNYIFQTGTLTSEQAQKLNRLTSSPNEEIFKEGQPIKLALKNIKVLPNTDEINKQISEILGTNFIRGSQYHKQDNMIETIYGGHIGNANELQGFTYSNAKGLNLEHGAFVQHSLDTKTENLSHVELYKLVKELPSDNELNIKLKEYFKNRDHYIFIGSERLTKLQNALDERNKVIMNERDKQLNNLLKVYEDKKTSLQLRLEEKQKIKENLNQIIGGSMLTGLSCGIILLITLSDKKRHRKMRNWYENNNIPLDKKFEELSEVQQQQLLEILND